jgi:hypothetical protein
MKSNFPHIGLAKLCGWFGVTRQAYYQNGWKGIEISIEEDLLLKEVLSIRKNHKRMGTRKLYEKLFPFMLDHQIKMGRDALFDLLSSNHLLVRKRKRRIQTTQSFHWLRKYPNLIREFIPTGPNQLWVSDITYWKINGGHVYISFITDAYSHKVVGFHVAQTLEAVESVQALKMALSGLFMEPDGHFQLIHHSDRGVQYLNDNQVKSIEEAREVLTRSVRLYNEDRPHMSIGNQYPSLVHEQKIQTERLWKNYYKRNPTIVNQYQD